jgi:hypothetical protein
MPRQNESNTKLMLKPPWWASDVLGIFAFAALRLKSLQAETAAGLGVLLPAILYRAIKLQL